MVARAEAIASGGAGAWQEPAHRLADRPTLAEVFRRYGAVFQSAAAALKMLAADRKFVGSSRLGFSAVLHTWSGQLEYHPHTHWIVPGGALSDDPGTPTRWCPSRGDFFVPVRALSQI